MREVDAGRCETDWDWVRVDLREGAWAAVQVNDSPGWMVCDISMMVSKRNRDNKKRAYVDACAGNVGVSGVYLHISS